MKQMTLAAGADQGAGFEHYRKPTRREAFLATMESIVPWAALCAVIEPYYPKAGNGRPPIGLERMLRIHLLQHWFNLADLACEESLYDSASLRRFVGIDLGREPVPDATTLLKFRRLLEKHQLAERLFAEVGRVLQASGVKLKTGTIVDATIIGAPSSTKNEEKSRDPEMHQTRKGQQWFFGMKLHIGVDSQSGLAHSAVVTPANVHDKHALPQLLHGQERRVYGDSAYASQQKRPCSGRTSDRSAPISGLISSITAINVSTCRCADLGSRYFSSLLERAKSSTLRPSASRCASLASVLVRSGTPPSPRRTMTPLMAVARCQGGRSNISASNGRASTARPHLVGYPSDPCRGLDHVSNPGRKMVGRTEDKANEFLRSCPSRMCVDRAPF